ncbi:MAG: hypothetical protein QOJ99_4101, partial [Bryobacterales bacterium]|nr:hypothetical protein [Bryobacterales bacterium]
VEVKEQGLLERLRTTMQSLVQPF